MFSRRLLRAQPVRPGCHAAALADPHCNRHRVECPQDLESGHLQGVSDFLQRLTSGRRQHPRDGQGQGPLLRTEPGLPFILEGSGHANGTRSRIWTDAQMKEMIAVEVEERNDALAGQTVGRAWLVYAPA